MLKFLRKYNQKILIVGMVLLMIAFLLPQTVTQCGQATAGSTFMRIDGRKVSNKEWQKSTQEAIAIDRLLPGLMQTVGITDGADHYVLLTEEARRAGFVGGPGDGADYLPVLANELVRMQYAQFVADPQQLESISAMFRDQLAQRAPGAAADAKLTVEEFNQALANLRGIIRMRLAYVNAATRLSDKRVQAQAREKLDTATVEYVFVPGDRAAAGIAEPDEAALAAHYERFKGNNKGTGEYGIGYTLPPRAKVEWLMVDRAAIEGLIEADRIEVWKRFLAQNPQGKPEEFETKRQEIEEALRGEQVDRVMREAEAAVRAEVARATARLERTGDTYVLPEDWDSRRPTLELVGAMIVQRVKDQTGLTIPVPQVYRMDEKFRERMELSQLPGIGRSQMMRGSKAAQFYDLALGVAEAGGEVPGFQTRVMSAEPLLDTLRNEYFFTILTARPESTPDSIDEIRVQAATDWKKLQGFERLVAEADVYKQRAIAEGLEQIAAETVTGADGVPLPALGVKKGLTVSRSGGLGDGNVNVQAFKDAVMNAAVTLDPTADISAVDAAERTVAVALPEKLGLALARVTGFRPLTVESYRMRDDRVRAMMQSDALKDREDPFSLDLLRKRLRVEIEDADEKDADAAADGGADATK